jgi:hypothetical protein
MQPSAPLPLLYLMSCEDLPELEAQLKEATEQEATVLIGLLQTLPLTFKKLSTSKIEKTVKRIYSKYPRLRLQGKKLISSLGENNHQKTLKDPQGTIKGHQA